MVGSTYIALLRGINVCGQKAIQMDALRAMFERLGFYDIANYIQSGNVVFSTPPTGTPVLADVIHAQVEAKLQRTMPFVLKSQPTSLHRYIAQQAVWGIVALLVLLSFSGWAQPNVQVRFDNAHILIGDQIQLTVDIAAAPGTAIDAIGYAQWAEGKVKIWEEGPLNTIAETPQLLMQQQVLLTSFDTGYHRMPPLEVVYTLNGVRDTVRSGNLGLTVATVPVGEDAELRDNKDIIAEPFGVLDALPYLLAALIIGFIVRYALRRRARARVVSVAPPPPPAPPHVVALEKLDALAADAAWERGEIKAFQTELTYVLREYLEARFGINALEATTPEIVRDVQQTPLATAHTAALKEVLETADRVKFAKAVPPVGVHPAALAAVRAFVAATAPVPPPADDDNETNAPQP